MFTIITSQKFDKKKFHFKKMKLHHIVQNEVKFCVVRLRNNRKIDWQKLERLLGDTKTRTIATIEMDIPQKSLVKAVDCAAYSHMLTLNALEIICCFHKEYIKSKSVTLIDVGCRYQSYADILVRYFCVVRIITNKTNFYNIYKDAKFYEYGANILVSDQFYKTASDTVLFVSPDGIILPEMTNQNTPIITARKLGFEIYAPVYHSFRADTPTEYLQAIPKGISNFSGKHASQHQEMQDNFLHSYQAALYEYCGLRSLSKSNPIYGYVNHDRQSMEDIKFNILTIDTK